MGGRKCGVVRRRRRCAMRQRWRWYWRGAKRAGVGVERGSILDARVVAGVVITPAEREVRRKSSL